MDEEVFKKALFFLVLMCDNFVSMRHSHRREKRFHRSHFSIKLQTKLEGNGIPFKGTDIHL
jgi:hypothetical protein